ncbi:REST corepressor 2-like [Triticum urartu]|uniref:REST corepressor 2-like n=1 Tax=Triticum urartu TaxID=4572 RepID=UPI002043AA02|nr:REST corepressor 2-like [Triticum urartu]
MATATTTVQAQPGLDAREWDEGAYRQGILRERDLSCRTLFRTVFYDHRDEPDPHVLLAAASSNGPSRCLPASPPPPPPTAPPSFRLTPPPPPPLPSLFCVYKHPVPLDLIQPAATALVDPSASSKHIVAPSMTPSSTTI